MGDGNGDEVRKKNNFKVAIIGPYPPPYGGVSIHVQRMHYILQERNVDHTVYTKIDPERPDLVDISRKENWWLKYFFTAKENIIHFHNFDWREGVLSILMGFRGKKVILTIHGEKFNDEINQSIWFKRKIFIWSLKNVDTVIAVNPKIKDLIISLGARPERVECIPAFITPIARDEDIAGIPQQAWAFINSHKPIVSANASKIVFYNNEDLYGIDMCIDLCANLKNNYPQIGFVFCLPEVGDYEYLEQMKQKIKEKGIENNFLLQTKPCQMYPIIMKSDIFVRPTNTDGDAVSLREALCFKIPSIASDVVSRPEGVVIFRSRDTNDFTSKVKDVLDNHSQYKKKLINIKCDNNAEKVIKIYQKLGLKEKGF